MGAFRAGFLGIQQTAARHGMAEESEPGHRYIVAVVALGIIVGAFISPSVKVESVDDASTPRIASPATP